MSILCIVNSVGMVKQSGHAREDFLCVLMGAENQTSFKQILHMGMDGMEGAIL